MQYIKKVAFICFPGFQALDLVGPMEVFSLAKGAEESGYESCLLSYQGGPITSASGMTITTEKFMSLEGFDSLIIVGGHQVTQHNPHQYLIPYIQEQKTKVKRIVSICTGAFLLARAGLLAHQKVTTHWSCTEQLKALVPSAEVIEDALYIKSGNIYTSAGISAGMDLALSLVEEDHGKSLSISIARELVLFYHRPGGQKQFSDLLQAQSVTHDKVKLACVYIQENLIQELTVSSLAEYVNMSSRNFSRQFTEQLGLPPGKYVQKSRVERAKYYLEQGQLSIAQVANKVGINSITVLSRLFKKYLAISPNDYKKRFYKTSK
ncbi:GlxA family transcriptional regulator [Pseudoalteromonas denitrificans]|uniref:Transcriptional regulator GlxA family, contains an amidase domain and an AraC-type DNA-binding HTH domain n=1 Tax=Pseudoalteromonas denitrificans DSM 6059 TaxID=1123010 RepID=A0A1I1KFP0_9GAMM|nr:GlxA family transcriptional regulator [Pseudoalteromonas denitrificans]SFC57538.1 Transcriptional regulator GlxA family, contains an amidase domain and an AraC-type DNA-binding HTH domain [Pseudoalteromonas denitrificans DSM 6059]